MPVEQGALILDVLSQLRHVLQSAHVRILIIFKLS
jgi:hypothetical protein